MFLQTVADWSSSHPIILRCPVEMYALLLHMGKRKHNSSPPSKKTHTYYTQTQASVQLESKCRLHTGASKKLKEASPIL